MSKNLTKSGSLLLLTVLLSMLLAMPVKADTNHLEFTVDSTSDMDDFVINSICSTGAPTGGPCTLRAAITEANWCSHLSPGACGDYVLINIPSGTYTLTLAGANENNNATGDLDITLTNLEIILRGDQFGSTVIDGNHLDRVFDFRSADVWARLEYLSVRGGYLELSTTHPSQSGGGINNLGDLQISDSMVENNSIVCLPGTEDVCYQGVGGGIFSSGPLQIYSSSIRNNSATRGGGMFYNGATEMIIQNSTFSGNQAVSAGAMNLWGPTYLINSTVSGNYATGAVAGISIYGSEGFPNTVKLANVTIANNRIQTSGVVNILHSANTTVLIRNTIIANPQASGLAYNCQSSATWTSSGYNIYSDSTCPSGGTGDLQNTNPLLTALMFQGGPTQTHGLLPGSPAIDRRPAFCELFDSGTVSSDQRGVNRDALCDIGAFEGVAYPVYLPAVLR